MKKKYCRACEGPYGGHTLSFKISDNSRIFIVRVGCHNETMTRQTKFGNEWSIVGYLSAPVVLFHSGTLSLKKFLTFKRKREMLVKKLIKQGCLSRDDFSKWWNEALKKYKSEEKSR